MLLESECLDNLNDTNDWLTGAGMIENLLHDFQECSSLLSKLKSDTSSNTISYLVNTSEIMSSVQLPSEKYVAITNKVLSNLLTLSNKTSHDNVIDHFLEHDPGNRKTVESASQRKYLMSLGPYQPKLATYPKNSNIAHGKQNQFSSLWFKEFPHLEYSVVNDTAFCFIICSLFPKGPNRNFSDTAWVKTGVNTWHKFKSRDKKIPGKLAQHFSSLLHKSALIDFSNFLNYTNHIDCILNKSNRLNEINIEYQKCFNQKVITMLMDITGTLAHQGLAFRGEGENE